ncbi:MAG: lipoate--protein ligase family protein [Bacteroidetes bacterium]|nr:lipoate--protein ligase family protein [Bacteroidota bacterium]
MAFDERLARRMCTGEQSGGESGRVSRGGSSDRSLPVLRLFRWRPWAISLGYNQDRDEIDADACSRDGVDVVRRPTGGRAILHAEELTYSVVMPAGRKGVLQVYHEISRALVRGLALFGVEARLQRSQPDFVEKYRRPSSVPCFATSARYEIEWGGRKLVGSAQRRFSGEAGSVVLQHGSILCGPAHQQFSRYLRLERESVREQIDHELRGKTVDLSTILGHRVETDRLAACIRQGFELEWNISFIEGD